MLSAKATLNFTILNIDTMQTLEKLTVDTFKIEIHKHKYITFYFN